MSASFSQWWSFSVSFSTFLSRPHAVRMQRDVSVLMPDHQGVLVPPSSQLPVPVLLSLHHLGRPPFSELPHTDTAALTQAHHAAAVNVHFTKPCRATEEEVCITWMCHKQTYTSLVLRLSSSHLPVQPSGGYSQVDKTDLPLRGLMPTKENRAGFDLASDSKHFSLALFSSWSRELRN